VAKLDEYLDAATRANTRRSYAGALRHYEVEAGRPLPATGEQVAHYLADFAGELSINTLKQRLAALAGWHKDHGFVDPTRAPVVRKALKGIQAVHALPEKRATPLPLVQLGQVADWLERAHGAALARSDAAAALRHRRDRALVLLGFWRGFRGDDLLGLHVEHLTIVPGEGMQCFLPHSKGDRHNAGRSMPVPALSRWCPVSATVDWLTDAGLSTGPVFRAIDQWGHLGEAGLHASSFIPLLRQVFAAAGLSRPDGYSGHSLRRGFAGWADAQGWDLKTLMAYVGWKDIHSAMRYVDADPFARARIEAGLPQASPAPPALPAPTPVAPVEDPAHDIELVLKLSPFAARGRTDGARKRIETACLAAYGAVRDAADGSRYRLRVPPLADLDLGEAMDDLLAAMYAIADANRCLLEATLREPARSRRWT
jgi:integrase